MLTDDQIDAELRQLEARRQKLLALLALKEQVNDLEEAVESKLDKVVSECACEFGASASAIVGKGRPDHVVKPRHVAMFLMRQLFPGKSLAQLSLMFHRRDHGTVSYAVRQVENRCVTDKGFALKVERIRDRLINDLATDRGGQT